MAHPYHHARSSAKRYGGQPEDYLQAHCFMDSTKAHIADARHRLLLHNSWGIFLAEDLLGTTFTRASDGKVVPTRLILEQHVMEDFTFIPTLDKCFEQLPREALDEDDNELDHARWCVAMEGGQVSDYLPIHAFLNSTRAYMADKRHQRLLHNAWGVSLVERKFGREMKRPSDGVIIQPKFAAQYHIIRDFLTDITKYWREVPTVAESLEGIVVQKWMHENASPLSKVLRDKNLNQEERKGA